MTAKRLSFITVVISLLTALISFVWKWQNEIPKTEAAYQSLTHQEGTEILSNNEKLKFLCVEEADWAKDWREWPFIKNAFQHRADGAIEILIHDTEIDQQQCHSFWWFKLDEHSTLFQAKAPLSASIKIGYSWKPVDSNPAGRKDKDPDGVLHLVGKSDVYALYLAR